MDKYSVHWVRRCTKIPGRGCHFNGAGEGSLQRAVIKGGIKSSLSPLNFTQVTNLAEPSTACLLANHLETPSTWPLVTLFLVFTGGGLSLGLRLVWI